MNDIQQRVFRHLTATDGSGQRGTALAILTRNDFFTNLTVEESVDRLNQFIEEHGPNGAGSFCADGIARFCQAVGIDNPLSSPSEPDTQVDSLYLNVHFDLRRWGLPLEGNDDENEAARGQIDEIMSKLVNLLALAQGTVPTADDTERTWNLANVTLDEWDSY